MISKFILLVIFLLSTSLVHFDPASENDISSNPVVGMILTWQQDPTSTMTIDWHTQNDGQPSVVEYKIVGTDEWEVAFGKHFSYPFSDLIIHRVELTSLEPDMMYRFRFGQDSRAWKFRTMPVEAHRPIRFAAGGDIRHKIEWMEQTNRRVATYDPDFIIWGGDLAYADGRPDRLYRWLEYMDAMMNTLVTADSRVIPVLTGIGNHEVLGGYYHRDDHDSRDGIPPYTQDDDFREKIAPFYYKFFAFPGQPGYGVLDFGNYMSIILLDTDHSNPVDGEQTSWLESVLAERRDVPHIFPSYHVPSYPARTPSTTGIRIRENWIPLFEEYGVKVVFENHDHIYKRTYPIRNGGVSADGIVYIGDGAWGVNTREIGSSRDSDAWYIKRASSERHFILGTIHGNLRHFLVVNEDGVIIDEYPRTPHIDLDVRRLANPWTTVSGESY